MMALPEVGLTAAGPYRQGFLKTTTKNDLGRT